MAVTKKSRFQRNVLSEKSITYIISIFELSFVIIFSQIIALKLNERIIKRYNN